MEIITRAGAIVHQMSGDEACLDLSSLCQAQDADASLRMALPLARQLKQRILSERQFTATIGIASNKSIQGHNSPQRTFENERIDFIRVHSCEFVV